MRLNARVLRILDANINRFCEGCRVVEEYLRFCRSPSETGAQLDAVRTLRRRMRSAVRGVSGLESGLLSARDTSTDPGAGPILDRGNLRRSSVRDVAAAGLKRMQEAGRVLEEYSKIVLPRRSGVFKSLRFGAYALEKGLLSVSAAKSSERKR